LFNAFKQGVVQSRSRKAGNCAAVALIKAAIGTYGLHKVFEISERSSELKLVTLRDNTSFEISDKEIAYAQTQSKFAPGDMGQTDIKEIFEYAQLCFAVLCKSYHLHSGRDEGFEITVDNLNAGYSTKTIYKLLGLPMKSVGNNPSYELLQPYKHLVVWNTAHAVYYSEGFYDEAFDLGTPIERIENLRKKHCSLAGRFVNGCKPRGAYLLVR
jgi:hypothetical protein